MEKLLVYSNLTFLFPAIRAIARGLITRFVFNALVPFTSGGYHDCRLRGIGDGSCWFGISYPVFHAADFVVAQMAIPLTALYLIHWKGYAWVERIFILAFLTGMIFMVIQGGDTFIAQGIVVAISLSIVVIYWIGYALVSYWDTGKTAFPKYNWGNLIAGISFTSIAVALFQYQNMLPSSDYWSVHSAWHVMAAMGQYFILGVKEPDPHAFYRALDSNINMVEKEEEEKMTHAPLGACAPEDHTSIRIKMVV